MRCARVLLIAAMSLAGTAACGKHDDAVQAVVPGAPAGDVTELTGTVTATRDGKTRALKLADVIAGDDVVKTGADGRVTIVLRHNQVPWSLGPGKEKRVADSGAWAAAKGASGESVSDDHSAAAGRHAERSATDTESSTSAVAPRAERKMDEHEELEDRKQAEAQRAALEQQLAAAKDEAESARMRATLEEERAKQPDHKPGGGGAKGGGGHRCDPGDPLCSDDLGSGSATVSADTTVDGAMDPASTMRVVQAKQPELRRCFTKNAPKGQGKLRITFEVGPDGKVAKATIDADASLQPMVDCAHGVAMKLRFGKATKAWSFVVPFVFAATD